MTTRTYGIGLYAPAGFVVEPEAIARAIGRLEAAGHRVVVDPTVTTRWQRFSAPDTERLAAVTRMTEDPRVELAIAVRGGRPRTAGSQRPADPTWQGVGRRRGIPHANARWAVTA